MIDHSYLESMYRIITMVAPAIFSLFVELLTKPFSLLYVFQQKVKFWFATGGAGFCISRALALKMTPVAG